MKRRFKELTHLKVKMLFIELKLPYVTQELHVDEAEAAVAATTRRKWLGGRKMAMDDSTVKKEMVKGNIINTGANPSVGKCDGGGKGDLNLECELWVRARSPPSSVKLVGLIPFSSDYHAPKTHPPKNN